jgi:hypothetical protein
MKRMKVFLREDDSPHYFVFYLFTNTKTCLTSLKQNRLNLSLRRFCFLHDCDFYCANEILNCNPARVFVIGAEVDIYGITLR